MVKRTQRRGTVVADHSSQIFDLWQFRFVDENETRVFPIFSHVLTIERFNKRGPWNRFLEEDGDCIRIVREIDIDHQFKMHASYYLAYSRFQEMLDFKPADLVFI